MPVKNGDLYIYVSEVPEPVTQCDLMDRAEDYLGCSPGTAFDFQDLILHCLASSSYTCTKWAQN